jgi:hypothetical protein
MEEADELERAAEWRMRKADSDPRDTVSRDAAAIGCGGSQAGWFSGA